MGPGIYNVLAVEGPNFSISGLDDGQSGKHRIGMSIAPSEEVLWEWAKEMVVLGTSLDDAPSPSRRCVVTWKPRNNNDNSNCTYYYKANDAGCFDICVWTGSSRAQTYTWTDRDLMSWEDCALPFSDDVDMYLDVQDLFKHKCVEAALKYISEEETSLDKQTAFWTMHDKLTAVFEQEDKATEKMFAGIHFYNGGTLGCPKDSDDKFVPVDMYKMVNTTKAGKLKRLGKKTILVIKKAKKIELAKHGIFYSKNTR